MIATVPSATDQASASQSPHQARTSRLFEELKTEPQRLRKFLWQMPKGGDIHHHALGAIWAEDYLDTAIRKSLWIEPASYRLFFDQVDALTEGVNDALPLTELLASQPESREEIIDHWSVRNHKENNRDGHHWFFSTFQKFEKALIGNEPEFLSNLCEAAARENVQYLETMIAVPSIIQRVAQLVDDKEWMPGMSVRSHLAEWYAFLEAADIDQWASYNAEVMEHWIKNTETHGVTLRFQTLALRIMPDPDMVFAHLVLAFKTAMLSPHLVGVNLAAPEDHKVSLSDYNTHMAMFAYLKEKFPEVNIALHAGELVLGKGDCQEQDLRFHIDKAVATGKAQRIGHGVDLLQETNHSSLLKTMKAQGVAVEINLECNEVILGTDPGSHPLKAYLAAEVPVCICSDDPAILRSDLTHQYELLVDYLPEISYGQVKALVYNAIHYSFLGQNEKLLELEKLNKAFEQFEAQITQHTEKRRSGTLPEA